MKHKARDFNKNPLFSRRLHKTLGIIRRDRRIAIDSTAVEELIKVIKRYSESQNADDFAKSLAQKEGISFTYYVEKESGSYKEAQSLEEFIKSGPRPHVLDFIEAFYYNLRDEQKVSFYQEIHRIFSEQIDRNKGAQGYMYPVALPFSIWLTNMDETIAVAFQRLEKELERLTREKEMGIVELKELTEQVRSLERELQNKTIDFKGALSRLYGLTASLNNAISSLKATTGRTSAIAETLLYIKEMAGIPQTDSNTEEILTHLRVILLLQALIFLIALIQPDDN